MKELASKYRVVLPVLLFMWKQSFAVVNSAILIVLLRPFREPLVRASKFLSQHCAEVLF